jgi:hypothetical protein
MQNENGVYVIFSQIFLDFLKKILESKKIEQLIFYQPN